MSHLHTRSGGTARPGETSVSKPSPCVAAVLVVVGRRLSLRSSRYVGEALTALPGGISWRRWPSYSLFWPWPPLYAMVKATGRA